MIDDSANQMAAHTEAFQHIFVFSQNLFRDQPNKDTFANPAPKKKSAGVSWTRDKRFDGDPRHQH